MPPYLGALIGSLVVRRGW